MVFTSIAANGRAALTKCHTVNSPSKPEQVLWNVRKVSVHVESKAIVHVLINFVGSR